MTTPTLIVQAAFTDTALEPSPTWTVVPAAAVESFTMRSGRQSDVEDSTQPSLATLVLDNGDREFDPAYTAGTYYGNLRPGAQIRVSAVLSGSTTVLFRGIVNPDGWQQVDYKHPASSKCRIVCTDLMGYLSQRPMRLPAFESYLERCAYDNSLLGVTTQKVFHWPLDDAGSGSVFEGVQTFQDPIQPAALFNYAPAYFVRRDEATTVKCQPSVLHSETSIRAVRSGSLDTLLGAAVCTHSSVVWHADDQYTGAENTTFGFGFRLRSFPTIDGSFLVAAGTAGNGITLDRDGTLKACWDEGTTFVTAPGKLEIGRDYHLTVTMDQAATDARIYIDGRLAASDPAYPTTVSGSGIGRSTIGAHYIGGHASDDYIRNAAAANVTDFFAYGATMTPAEVSTLANLWRGSRELRTVQAAADLLAASGVATETVGPAEGRVSVAEMSELTPNVSTIIGQYEATEMGRIYYDHPNQRVSWVTADDLTGNTLYGEAQTVFTDNPADTSGLRYSAPRVTARKPVNRVTVTDADGAVWARQDWDSIADYGVSARTVTSRSDVPGDPLAVAQHVLRWNESDDVAYNVANVTVTPTSTAQFVEALAVRLFEGASVKRTPHNVGSERVDLMTVEGMSLTVGDGDRSWKFDMFLGWQGDRPDRFVWDGGTWQTDGYDILAELLA